MKTDATWNNHEPAERLSADNLSAYLRGLPAKAKMALRGLIHMHYGRLSIRMPDGRAVLIEGRSEGPEAVLILHNWNLAHQSLTNGTIGVAESYMAGDWESPDVTAFLELFLVNVEVGTTWLAAHAVCCVWSNRSATGCAPIAAPRQGRTSRPTMISATLSTQSGSTRP
jgi:cyclopropane-fatty-acyl-phospholipid synthase